MKMTTYTRRPANVFSQIKHIYEFKKNSPTQGNLFVLLGVLKFKAPVIHLRNSSFWAALLERLSDVPFLRLPLVSYQISKTTPSDSM